MIGPTARWSERFAALGCAAERLAGCSVTSAATATSDVATKKTEGVDSADACHDVSQRNGWSRAHGGLYAMPSPCGSAWAAREWFRAFAIHCPGTPSSTTPGSSITVNSSAAMSTRPSPRVERLGTPKTPAIRFTRAMTFVAYWFTHLLRSVSLLAPCTHLTGCPASGAFTSGLPAGWSPFPLQDITQRLDSSVGGTLTR